MSPRSGLSFSHTTAERGAMSAESPPLPAAARVLTGLLAHTAAVTGYRAARILLTTTDPAVADGIFDRSGIIPVHPHDPLPHYARATAEPVAFPGHRLPETVLAGQGSGDVLLLRLSPGPATERVVALLGARNPARPDTALTALREVLDAAVTAVLETVAAERHRHALEAARRSADARVAAEKHLDTASDAVDPMAALVRVCAELSGKPALLFDPGGRTVTAAGATARVGLPDPVAVLRAGGVVVPRRVEPVLLTAGPATGLTRRKLLVPVVERGTHFGWLALDEYPTGFTEFDQHLIARVARRVGAQFLVQHRIARVAWNARSALTRQLVRGTGAAEDLAASGDYLGVDTGAHRVLVYLLVPRHEDGDLDRTLAQYLEQRLGVEVLSTRGSEGILLLVAADAAAAPPAVVYRVKAALVGAAEVLGMDPELAAGVSGVCAPSALSRAYREAREVARCIDRFSDPGHHRVLAVDDLGPARLFLANGPTTAVQQFVEDTLGALLHGDTAATELLRTLDCWFGSGRSVRAAATHLGIHENTVRLRLARVRSLTGLDVAADPADQLSVQTALLVLRLRGGRTPDTGGDTPAAGDDLAASPRTRSAAGVSGARPGSTERRTA